MREDLLIPRYSAKPIEEYSRKVRGLWTGPAYSSFLRSDAEAWNLAWLSHPFEFEPEHRDPHFTNLVRSSARMFKKMLRLPPADFARRFPSVAQDAPLFVKYGAGWLDRVVARAAMPWAGASHVSGLDVSQAADYLRKFRSANAI